MKVEVVGINHDFTALAVKKEDNTFWWVYEGDKELVPTTEVKVTSAISKGDWSQVVDGKKILFGKKHYKLDPAKGYFRFRSQEMAEGINEGEV